MLKMLTYHTYLSFCVVVSLNYANLSLKKRDLVPNDYLELSEKYQKGMSSYVICMAQEETML